MKKNTSSKQKIWKWKMIKFKNLKRKLIDKGNNSKNWIKKIKILKKNFKNLDKNNITKTIKSFKMRMMHFRSKKMIHKSAN